LGGGRLLKRKTKNAEAEFDIDCGNEYRSGFGVTPEIF